MANGQPCVRKTHQATFRSRPGSLGGSGHNPVEVLRQHPWPPTKWSEFNSRQRVDAGRCRLHGCVAQLEERLREDQKAHGSTPCAATIQR